MAIGFVQPQNKLGPARRYVVRNARPPAIGDVVEGTHPEGFEVIGRIERGHPGRWYVRTDDGKLYDMNRATVSVVERCNAPTVKIGGWTYFAGVLG